jgi:hypothetical protein
MKSIVIIENLVEFVELSEGHSSVQVVERINPLFFEKHKDIIKSKLL